MFALSIRERRRVEQIEEHVPGCRDFRQQQVERAGRPLQGGLQSQLTQPLGKQYPFGGGRCFDLAQLLRSQPCGDCFRAETGTNIRIGKV